MMLWPHEMQMFAIALINDHADWQSMPCPSSQGSLIVWARPNNEIIPDISSIQLHEEK